MYCIGFNPYLVTCVCLFVCLCVCAYVCVGVCVYVCVFACVRVLSYPVVGVSKSAGGLDGVVAGRGQRQHRAGQLHVRAADAYAPPTTSGVVGHGHRSALLDRHLPVQIKVIINISSWSINQRP